MKYLTRSTLLAVLISFLRAIPAIVLGYWGFPILIHRYGNTVVARAIPALSVLLLAWCAFALLWLVGVWFQHRRTQSERAE